MDSTCGAASSRTARHGGIFTRITANQRPYLHDDILLHILNFASKDLLRTLTQTCRMLHSQGARYLLRDGVSLATDKQILSFMLFIVHNSGGERPRILRLRELTLSREHPSHIERPGPDSVPPSEVPGMLLQGLFVALASFGVLTRLTIYDSEEVLGLHPALPEAIAGLRTLLQLNVSFVGPRTVRMLKAFQSTLFWADISIESEVELPLEDKNPMLLLHGSRDSLRDLSATFSVSTPDSPQYPLLTTLRLSYTDAPRTQHYVHAFPHLRTLTTWDCCGWGHGESIEELRIQNQSEQERLGTWPALESYQGTIMNLYLLGIRCPIRTVALSHFEDELEPEMLHAVLGDARPRRLQLRIEGGYWLVAPEFLETFTRPGVEALRRFELIVQLEEADRTMCVYTTLDSILLSIVRPLKDLVSFKLCFDCSSIKRDRYGMKTRQNDPLERHEQDLADWDIDDYAHRIEYEASTKLQSISVSLKGHRTRAAETVTLGPKWSFKDNSSDDEDDEGKHSTNQT
ncbi:hypothetical protein VTO73DRAFT_4247 [Trametes versicolor]